MSPSDLAMQLSGGLAIFLYGMKVTSAGLQQAVAHRLKSLLQRLVAGRLSALALGVVLAAGLQSSSAASVVTIGLVSARLINMQQALALVLGAGIGTTVTPQLVTLNITDYALALVVVGVVLHLFLGRRSPGWGEGALGFSLIFFGMQIMLQAMEPLRRSPAVVTLLAGAAEQPWQLTIVGAVVTAVVQASSAVVALAVTMAEQGLLNSAGGLAVILGANVGTTVTGIIVSLVGSREARRVALSITLFNICAALAVLALFAPAVRGVELLPGTPGRQLAHAHTLFSLLVALLFLPVLPAAERLVLRLWPLRESQSLATATDLGPELLAVPELALHRLAQVVQEMGRTVSVGLLHPLCHVLDPAAAGQGPDHGALKAAAADVSTAYRRVAWALAEAGRSDLTPEQSQVELRLLLGAAEVRAAAEHALAVDRTLRLARERGVQFSDAGLAELRQLAGAAVGAFDLALAAWQSGAPDQATAVEDRHRALLAAASDSRRQHYLRVRQGVTESVETSDLHHQVLTALENLSEHALSLASGVGLVPEAPAPASGE